MKPFFIRLISGAIIIICTHGFSSCSSSKEIGKDFTYFQAERDTVALGLQERLIQPNDVLNIYVYSKTINQEQASLFNIPNEGADGKVRGFLVSQNGNIEMPLIGTVKAGGITNAQLQNSLVQKLSPYVKDPSVIIRLMQFKVNILGEVKSPGIQNFQTEKVTILDAISAANDLTDYGRRDNVLVIRDEAGQRKFYQVDLRSGALFKSPAYQLQSNDVVYVAPNRNKLKAMNTDQDAQRKTGLLLGITSTLISIAALIVNLTQ